MPITLTRSVGKTGPDLNTGVATMEISGDVLVTSAPLQDIIGVGDCIPFNDGSDQLVFIESRTDSTTFVVRNKDGGTAATASPGQAFEIFRCYQSAKTAENATENGLITEPTENDVNPSGDRVAADIVVRFACYADDVDTDDFSDSGATTDATRFTKYFTPVKANEVGVTQRHPGFLVAGNVGYRLEVTNISGNNTINTHDDFSKFEGLQLVVNEDTNTKSAFSTNFSPGDNISISHCILKGVYTSTGDGSGIFNNGGVDYLIWNNLVYDFNVGGIRSHGAAATVTAYHNTVVRCQNGFAMSSSGSMLAKNNLAIDSPGNDFDTVFAYDVGSTNNASSDATADDAAENLAAGIPNITLLFKDKAADNFHLDPIADRAIRGAGVDLKFDPILPIKDDIDGDPRPSLFGGGSDIGADQVRLLRSEPGISIFRAEPAFSPARSNP